MTAMKTGLMLAVLLVCGNHVLFADEDEFILKNLVMVTRTVHLAPEDFEMNVSTDSASATFLMPWRALTMNAVALGTVDAFLRLGHAPDDSRCQFCRWERLPLTENRIGTFHLSFSYFSGGILFKVSASRLSPTSARVITKPEMLWFFGSHVVRLVLICPEWTVVESN